MNRRQFIQTSSLAAFGVATLSSFAPFDKRKIGLQLYSLRDIVAKDPKSVLKKVAAFGYKELEAYSYNDGKIFGLKYKEFTDYAKSLGMKVTSGHHGYGRSESLQLAKGTVVNGWEKAVSDAKESGQEFMVVAYLTDDERNDYKKLCEALNKAGEICNKYGIRLNYHNHEFEFEQFEGQVAYHLMLKELDPKLVGMEMDLYWMHVANQNPLDYFAKYPGRFEQWHVKDMDKSDPKLQVDVGTGRIDFKSIFAKAKLAGLKHFYIEQEAYSISSSDSVEKSISNLKEIL
ncbi:MAG: sugar phosphate isomerase/epimerase [Cyclobacteriaceae bacterium]|nr:sugar phosphate isomerase/epimerase [Cyclobacteriaceae bacterium]